MPAHPDTGNPRQNPRGPYGCRFTVTCDISPTISGWLVVAVAIWDALDGTFGIWLELDLPDIILAILPELEPDNVLLYISFIKFTVYKLQFTQMATATLSN